MKKYIVHLMDIVVAAKNDNEACDKVRKDIAEGNIRIDSIKDYHKNKERRA